MDEEQKSLKKPDALVRKDIPPLSAITAMINTIFKETKPTTEGNAKPVTLHDTLTAFYLPDPDTQATWTVTERGDVLEIVAADDKGIVLVRGKATKSGVRGWTEDKVTTSGFQTMDMNLERYEPGSPTPTDRLRFSVLSQSSARTSLVAYTEPGQANLTHHHFRPFSLTTYATRFTLGK